jgi:DNA repair exonuclease SbcCD ATPase subunit
MITRLTSSATFPASGASLAADYQPQTGITAVVGENGAGKTFLSIEVTRWLLYGKAALRGMAGDYKDANAKGTFMIRGAAYEISRGKQEWIKDSGGSMLAKGAEEVTKKVTELMGYGLDVFDLCNAATQGNVQALGAMRPAQRKALIDSVLKLTDAEKAEKDCREEAKGYRREADALVKVLRSPGDEPVRPDGYLQSVTLAASLRAARELRDQHAMLKARRRDVLSPVRPNVGTFSEETIAELERHEQQRMTAAAEKWQLEQTIAKRPARPPHTDHIIEQGLRVHAYNEAVAARGETPTMSMEEIEAGEAAWDHRGTVMLASNMQATCPKCATEFRVGGEIPPEPAVSELELLRQRKAHECHDVPLPLRAHGDVTATPITPREADQLRTEARQHEAVRAAEARLIEIQDLVDRSAELNAMRAAKATMDAFLAEQGRYERVVAENAAVDAEIAKLDAEPPQWAFDSVVDRLRAAEAYEAEHARWRAEDKAFKETQAKIAEATFLAEEYALGAKGIADARGVVKALIAPKISRIATKLIVDMSMGKLQNLIVDDEMEITVGGQRIETLSGAGKTVANLALRVAMGRALVGHTFPVFLADEIDGDLSASRRAATLQALVSLKQHMSQIILVTHRGAEIADHVWDVEESTV